MKDSEKIVTRLAECGKIMASGKFSFYDLDYIKKALEMMLNATNKTIAKKNKQMQSDKKPCLAQAHSVYRINGAKYCKDCDQALNQ